MPCRRLQSLCFLEQSFVPIDLHALASIAPQLRLLILRECRLTCRDDFSFFDSGFANLERLDVTDSILHARLGAVNLPSLTHLFMPGFAAKLASPQSQPSFDCIDAFAGGGCPECTCLTFRPFVYVGEELFHTVSCNTFAALKSVKLEFDPWHTRDPGVWPAPLSQHDLPIGVTSLTCKSVFAAVGQAFLHSRDDLDLFFVLSIAAGSIEAGVHLEELCCEQCATCVIQLFAEDDGIEYEPDEEMHATHYRPLCSRLHGLTRLDLSQSPNCSQETVTQIVQSAPDLIYLEVAINWVGGWRQKMGMPCLGLSELTVHYHMGSQRASEPLALDLDLRESDGMDAFFIEGLRWEPMSQDRVTVSLDSHAAGGAVADAVCKESGDWTLRCYFGCTHDDAEEGPVTASFVVGPDLAWSASVQQGAA